MNENVSDSSQRIRSVFFINVTFTIFEFIGGWLTNSTAIMADAVHDLGDSISLGSAWFLSVYSEKGADSTFTYGYKRFSLLGALINGLVLVVGAIFILIETIPRLSNPEMPASEGMILMAIAGMVVNGYAAFKLSKGNTQNEKVLNWHLLEDALGWLAVLLVAIILSFYDLPILDPILSIVFTLFILLNVIKSLKNTVNLFLQATPNEEQAHHIKDQLCSIAFVQSCHHMHIWSLDGEKNVFSVHLVMRAGVTIEDIKQIKLDVAKILEEYGFEHSSVELEHHDEKCRCL